MRRSIRLRLLKPTAGEMFFRDDGEMKDLLKLDKKTSFALRRKIQIVFQDPYASLNPVHTIREAFDEPMRVHGIGGSKEKRTEMIANALKRVNLQPEYMYRYPHEFSGGQRQRICVAKALVMEPTVTVLRRKTISQRRVRLSSACIQPIPPFPNTSINVKGEKTLHL